MIEFFSKVNFLLHEAESLLKQAQQTIRTMNETAEQLKELTKKFDDNQRGK